MEFLGTEKQVNSIEPLVSICITTYQHSSYIEECLQSVLEQQTVFPFEIIIGEDESTDGTREICKEYAEKYPDKIRLFLRSRKDVRYINGNPTGRFNFLETLKAARGKYIAYCDGDDYWTDNNKLQKQFDYMEERPEVSLCFHNAFEVSQKGQKRSVFPNIKEDGVIPSEVIIEKGGGYCATNSVFFKSNILKDMPRWFVNAFVGDYSLYLLAIHNGKIAGLKDTMSCYRSGHQNSWSDLSNKSKNLHQYLESLKSMLYDFDEFSDKKYHASVNTRVALEEIYSAVKILGSGKWKYLNNLSISNKKYIIPALNHIFKRKLGL